jgi:outer membrane protein assembly factor BamD
MKKEFYYLFFLVLALQSCSGYNKIVKKDDYDKKFELANQLYDNKKWVKSINLYEQVYQRFPKTAQGEVSYYRLGKAFFNEKDYYMGGYYLKTFCERFPLSDNCEETAFLSTICEVKNSPEYSLDQEETKLALNSLQMFINRFPNSNLIDTCNKIMDGLRFKLEKKEFENIKLYVRTLNYKSASVYAETFLADYPKSAFREEVFYILVKNSYLLSKNSIEKKKTERIEKTIERYVNFAKEFPNSSRLKELNSYHDALKSELSTILTNTNKVQ